MNFAEQLAYWYLRLNGFFPLANFVLHHDAEHRTSDADLLAVRFPYVSENVGGQARDWDPRFMADWEIDLTRSVVGLIVEVKSGASGRADIFDPTPEWRIRERLWRMGMIAPGQEFERVLGELTTGRIAQAGACKVAKLFIGSGDVPAGAPWFHLTLDEIDRFVRGRMRSYRERKLADRLFFSGDLIQYLAWKGGAFDE
jgi:hypothetical protein